VFRKRRQDGQTEWQRIGNEIDAATVSARADFVNVQSFFARRRRKLLNNPSQSYPTQPQHDKDADD
jgi:hypothetical protein